MTRKILIALLICICCQVQNVRPEGKPVGQDPTIKTDRTVEEYPSYYFYAPRRDITTYELALLIPVLMEWKLPRPLGKGPDAFPEGDLYQIYRFDYERLGKAARHLKLITESPLPPKEIKPPKRNGAR